MDPFSIGLAVFSMIGGGQVARAQAAGQTAMIKGERDVRRAKQQEANENARLAQHLTNLGNQRILKAAGKNHAAALTNFLRQQDADTGADVEAGIAQSEAAGAYAANVASKGVAGGSVDMIDMALALRNSRANEMRERQQGQVSYDQISQVAGVMQQAVQSTDMGVKSMGQDTSILAPTVQRGTDYLGALANVGIGKLAWDFLGPQGGSTGLTGALKPTSYGLKAPKGWGSSSLNL